MEPVLGSRIGMACHGLGKRGKEKRKRNQRVRTALELVIFLFKLGGCLAAGYDKQG